MGRGDITGKLSKSKPKGAVISFDEEARKSFLTGFRKRKNDRRQYARQKIAEQVRQEKLSARQERRTMQKQALASAVSEDEEDGSDAEPEGAEVSTYASASGDALVTTVVEALLPDEDEKDEEDEKQWRVGGPSYTAPKKTKKFNLSQPLSLAVPGYKPKAPAPPSPTVHASAPSAPSAPSARVSPCPRSAGAGGRWRRHEDKEEEEEEQGPLQEPEGREAPSGPAKRELSSIVL